MMHFASSKHCTKTINENMIRIPISVHMRKEMQLSQWHSKEENPDSLFWILPDSKASKRFSWATPVTSWTLLRCLNRDTQCHFKCSWGHHQLPSSCYKTPQSYGLHMYGFLRQHRTFQGLQTATVWQLNQTFCANTLCHSSKSLNVLSAAVPVLRQAQANTN